MASGREADVAENQGGGVTDIDGTDAEQRTRLARLVTPDLKSPGLREAHGPRKGLSPLAARSRKQPDFLPEFVRTPGDAEGRSMSNPPLGPSRPADLPAQPNLEHLRKIAKQRLRAMQRIAPSAKLADAQFQIAREHGFASWRSLKAEVDGQRLRGRITEPPPTLSARRLPSDDAIRTILADRIDREGDGVGIVVGVIDAGGPRLVAHGHLRRDGRRKVAGDTIFEIGSVTKVFTSLLLSDMALRGEVALDDPAARYLPDGVTLPERGRPITLANLAAHTSGLPRSATNITPSDWNNPYADYTTERLYAFLSDYSLSRDVGERYEYSNIGAALLGHLLARRLGPDCRDLFRDRITGGLGMKDTLQRPSRGQARRLAQGHDAEGRPAPAWRDHPDAIVGGLLLSTAEDLLKFLAVALGYRTSPLKPAIDAQLAYPMRRIEEPGAPFSTASGDVAAGLGWHSIEAEGQQLVRHNGGTAGYRAFLGLNRAQGWGAVVLTNTGGARGGDDIGRHILAGAPLASGWPRRRRPISLAPFFLDRYVGRYRYPTGDWMQISRSDNGLTASLNGQSALPIAALSPTEFFYRTIEVDLTFETDGDGRAIALVTRSQARGENRALRE